MKRRLTIPLGLSLLATASILAAISVPHPAPHAAPHAAPHPVTFATEGHAPGYVPPPPAPRGATEFGISDRPRAAIEAPVVASGVPHVVLGDDERGVKIPPQGSVLFGGDGVPTQAFRLVPRSYIRPAILVADQTSVAITDSGDPVVIPANPLLPPATSEQVGITLANLALHYPWIALLISVMGSARLWFKPLSQLVHWFVLQTKTTADDEFVAEVERSRAWAWFWWVVDYVASIKRDPPGTVVTITKGASGTTALFLVGALGISALSTGCTGLAPGAEPFVVRSEQTIASCFATVDTFVHWEEANRESLPESVTAVADALRDDFPPAHNAALASLQVYKQSRSAEDKDQLTTWLATLRAMADQATKARTEISKS